MTAEHISFPTIRALLAEHPVLLFMKGEPDTPMCGFSARVVQILQHLGASVHGVNVLTDPDLREGIKLFNDWPTIPQLFIKGEFIGGCDIVGELFQNGELAELLKANNLCTH